MTRLLSCGLCVRCDLTSHRACLPDRRGNVGLARCPIDQSIGKVRLPSARSDPQDLSIAPPKASGSWPKGDHRWQTKCPRHWGPESLMNTLAGQRAGPGPRRPLPREGLAWRELPRCERPRAAADAPGRKWSRCSPPTHVCVVWSPPGLVRLVRRQGGRIGLDLQLLQEPLPRAAPSEPDTTPR